MAVERVQASSFIDTAALGSKGGLEKGSRKTDLSFGSILSKAQNESLANNYNSAKGNNTPKFELNVNNSDNKGLNQDGGKANSRGLVGTDGKARIDTGKVENKIESAIAKAVEEVREVIKDELGITDEELSTAMETLGLTMVDLLKPEAITAIVAEITGTETADLLLNEGLASSVMDIMRVQRNVTADLIEELDISPDEFKDMLQGGTINIALQDENTGEEIPKFEIQIDATKDDVEVVVKDESQGLVNAETDISEETANADTAVVTAKDDTAKEVKEDASKDDRSLVKADVEVTSDEEKETIRTNTEIVKSSSDVAGSDRQPKGDTEVISKTSDGENAENAVEVKPADRNSQNDGKGTGEEKSGGEKDESAPAPKTETRTSTNIRHFDHTRSVKTDGSISSFQQSMADAIKEAVGNTPEANVAEQLNNAARAEDIMRQITEQVKIQIKAETTSMELQLNPASLGKVGLHIESKGGVVTAQILAQNETVKSAIESQIVTLKESIEAKGIKVQEVEVTVASHAFEENLMGNQSSGRNFGADDREGNERSSRLRRINLGSEGAYGSGEAEAVDEGEELARRMMIDNGGSLDLMA